MFSQLPLKSLTYFESAARHLSFKEAARELNVTAAAVGQQVKLLEEKLNCTLFIRRTRAIELSEAGKSLLPHVQSSFETLRLGLAQINRLPDTPILNLTTVHSFAAKWLFPRLHDFYTRHPEIDVRLTATRQVMNFDYDKVDMAIRIAPKDPATDSLTSIKLFNESFIPVCSPRLLEQGIPLNKPEDLVNFTLIHDDSLAIYEDTDWSKWLSSMGLDFIDASRGPRFNPSTMPIQAATNGLGVALARKILVTDDLQAGRLIAPFDVELPSNAAYYLVYPTKNAQQAKIRFFENWLLNACKDFPSISLSRS